MSDLGTAAVGIIRNSIVSSIYIDDKIAEPFSEFAESDKKFYEVSKGLYESFRRENKSIDFYKYSAQKDWRMEADYLFKNRDLLVLDWQLNEATGLIQSETLKILKKAVQTDNLHFVSIYTETPKEKFNEIFYQVKAFFNPLFIVESVAKCQHIIDEIDAQGIETNFFASLTNSFVRLSLERDSERKIILEQLKAIIQEKLGNDNYKIFSKKIKEVNIDISKACEIFGYYLNKIEFVEALDFESEVRVEFISDDFIMVNHTIVQITNKSDPKPKDLFQFFTSAVQKVCGNLLTLISLEVRSLLRESSGFIGKDADSIKDAILFHQFKKKSGFFDFLMSIIKSHTVSYFDYKQGRLNTVTKEFWELYSSEMQIQPKLDEMVKEENKHDLVNELLKLNVYYNILHIKRSNKEHLRFGDVFFRAKDKSYFLCITAHCDCLRPKGNIKNNFFFIRGEKTDPTKLINDGDTVFSSYLKDGENVIAVRWNSRPVVLKIDNHEIQAGKLLGADGLNEQYELEYHSTIKENYTQRMANNSFAHAMRVGIDFGTL